MGRPDSLELTEMHLLGLKTCATPFGVGLFIS